MGNKGSTPEKKCFRKVRKNPKLSIDKESPLGILLSNWGKPPYNEIISKLDITKEDMVNLCCFVWWEDEKVEWPRLGTNDYFACQNLYEYVSRKTCKSLVNELDYALIWNPGKWVTLTMSGPSPHKVTSIYLQEEEKNEIEEEEDDEKSMKYLPPPYNPNLPQPTNVQIPIPPPLPAPVTQAQGAVRGGPYKVLVKELEQLKKDIKNFPFKDKPLQAFPLREVPNGVDGQGQARISFVHEPLKASELRAFKKEMKSMIEDPIGVAEQLDLLLGANIYTWDELGVIQSMLFTAEERQLIQRAAHLVWTREHNPQAQGAILADVKFPVVRPNWDNNNAADRQNMEDMRVLLIRGIREAVPKAQNMSKALMIEQEKEESPATFLQRLKDGMRKYSGTDPDDPANTLLVKIQFVIRNYKNWRDGQGKV